MQIPQICKKLNPFPVDKYSLFNSLKRYNKNLKTILFVDSPTTKEVSDVLLNEASRRALMKLIIQHLRRNNFDGIDLRFIFVTPFEKNGPSYTYQFIKVGTFNSFLNGPLRLVTGNLRICTGIQRGS